MNDTIIGVDINNAHIFMAEKMGDHWLGTGLSQLFTRHPNLKATLNWFIGSFPGVQGVQVILEGKYAYIDLGQAARDVMLTGALRAIQQQIGGENMDSPPEKQPDDKVS